MVVRLQLESGEILERSETNITIGSSTSCQIVIANDRRVAPVHATLRKLGDRWLIESSEPPQVCVDDSAPAQRHWLQSEGQVIRLTLSGPQIIFQPAENGLERTGQKSSSSELRLVESNDPACDKHESETPKPSERRISPTQLNPSIGVKSSGGVQSSEMPDSPPCGVRSPFSIEQKQLAAGMLIFALLLIAFTLGSRTIDTSGSPKVQAAKTGDQKPQSVADLKQVPLQELPHAPASPPPAHVQNIANVAQPINQREQSRLSMVWIGVQLGNDLIPVASGIAISPRVVATSAVNVSVIGDNYRKDKNFTRFFVCQKGQKEIDISEFVVHPKFESTNPQTASIANLHYNIGILRLSRELHYVAPLAPENDLAELPHHPELEMMSYIRSSEKSRPATAVDQPGLAFYQGKFLKTLVDSGDNHHIPLIQVLLNETDGTEDGVLIDRRGRVIAILGMPAKESFFAVLINRLTELK